MTKTLLATLALALASSPAFACQVSMSRIKAEVVGSTTVDGVCVVTAIIQEIAKGEPCPIRSLAVGQEIDVKAPRANTLPNGCPQDEGYTLDGTITSLQGAYVLTNGTIE